LARRNFEGTRARPEARAGDFEIIADNALAFVEAAVIFAEQRSLSFQRFLLGIKLEIDFTLYCAASGQIDEDEPFIVGPAAYPFQSHNASLIEAKFAA
jgi:hypothetical protein